MIFSCFQNNHDSEPERSCFPGKHRPPGYPDNCHPTPDPAPPSCTCPELPSEYGYYSQNGTLYNTALYGGIRFENPTLQTNGLLYDSGVITVTVPGIYLVSYIVNFPSSDIASTTLALEVNNQSVVGTVRVINKNMLGTPYTASAEVILRLEQISSLRLSSSSRIQLPGPENNTAASLLLRQVLPL